MKWGEVQEWFNWHVWNTCRASNRLQGFESLPLRQSPGGLTSIPPSGGRLTRMAIFRIMLVLISQQLIGQYRLSSIRQENKQFLALEPRVSLPN